MRHLNETFLEHKGPTDVITFDYAALDDASGRETTQQSIEARTAIHGEIFICLDVAGQQARRFGVTTAKELARYVIHGVLHLLGYDDKRPQARRRMKGREGSLLRALERRCDFSGLVGQTGRTSQTGQTSRTPGSQ